MNIKLEKIINVGFAVKFTKLYWLRLRPEYNF